MTNQPTTNFAGSLIAIGINRVLYVPAKRKGTGEAMEPIALSESLLRQFVGRTIEMPSIAAGETVQRKILGGTEQDGTFVLNLSGESGSVTARVAQKS